jgi:tRNA 2-selenouridine synthase
MLARLPISAYFQATTKYTLIDVRSEGEFARGHIPGAVNIPLLNNEQRAQVGTLFKQEGREAAVLLGYQLLGPSFPQLYARFQAVLGGKLPLFYCWRGGLRSEISATLLHWGGSQVHVIEGGYKSYRTAVQASFANPVKLQIIGGLTGSGKTEILHFMRSKGHQVLDLEGLAHHKGSALGSLGMPPQPSTEMYENLVHHTLSGMDLSQTVWLENESRKIGHCALPEAFWLQMNQAPMLEVSIPHEVRVNRLVREYAHFPVEDLKARTSLIRKKLGGQHEQAAMLALDEGRFADWVNILLVYYDKSYHYFVQENNPSVVAVDWDWEDCEKSLQKLLKISPVNSNSE